MPPKLKPKPEQLLDLPTGPSGVGWSQISPLVECPKKYQFSKVRGIERAGLYLTDALSVGSLLHAGRAQWFHDGRQGELWRKQITAHAAKMNSEPGPKLALGAVDKSLTTFEGYINYWRVRPTTEVLAVEYPIGPRGVTPTSPKENWRTTRLDSIEHEHGKTWIGEAKSVYAGGASRVTSTYELHGQLLLQASLWGEEETKKFGPLAGIMLDPMVKGSTEKKPTGAPRTKVLLQSIKHALQWFRRDFDTWVEQSRLVTWNAKVERRVSACGTCIYKDLCSRGRDGALSYRFKDGTPLINWKPSEGKETPPWE